MSTEQEACHLNATHIPGATKVRLCPTCRELTSRGIAYCLQILMNL